MRSLFLPVQRCADTRCGGAFIGAGPICQACARRDDKISLVKTGGAASRADVREHKRLSLRKRLGLMA
jgi:hypothetical protein